MVDGREAGRIGPARFAHLRGLRQSSRHPVAQAGRVSHHQGRAGGEGRVPSLAAEEGEGTGVGPAVREGSPCSPKGPPSPPPSESCAPEWMGKKGRRSLRRGMLTPMGQFGGGGEG